MKEPYVQIKNTIFEWIPAECIDVWLTEEGEITRGEIKSQSIRLQDLDSAIFRNLEAS